MEGENIDIPLDKGETVFLHEGELRRRGRERYILNILLGKGETALCHVGKETLPNLEGVNGD